MKIEISLFKFDYKSDYLPYYKKYFLKIENEKTLLDILNSINNIEEFSYENKQSFELVVNGLYTDCSVSIKELVLKLGNELTIEPISIRRVMNDLLINEDDFRNKLLILEEFLNEDDIKRYEEYKRYFYASNSLRLKKEYIGDAIILLASDIIEENASLKDDILDKFKQEECSLEFHTSLENKLFKFDKSIENRILKLKEELNLIKEIEKQNFKINKNSSIQFASFKEEEEIKHTFKEFNIAYYSQKECEKTTSLLNKLKAKIITLKSKNNDLAKTTFHINQEFTFQLASEVILEAFDNEADFLVVDNEADFYLFDFNRKELERVSGREVSLPILYTNELSNLAYGYFDEAKKSLIKHYINPEII
ncbi:hypothetical protein CRU99_11405 [Malaciobacter mytili]|uniref:hypothetical protein n=1 Tax=Malaciobacter mytili TaxID=603050 RepID=UPI00100AFC0E|nr:hypothetical protein [Malaciobacter mytili]RXI38241.1 hypothetical protein CRU99_11405 [Malaciobacter mytili]